MTVKQLDDVVVKISPWILALTKKKKKKKTRAYFHSHVIPMCGSRHISIY
jgi:hypothetical protein